MKWWFLLSSILVFFLTANTEEFSFSTDKVKLEKCIEYYLSINRHSKIDDNSFRLSKMMARRFNSKSYTSDQFYKATNNMYYLIRDGRTSAFEDKKVPGKLQTIIRQVLESCVEKKNLPKFVYEPQVLTDLLDFLLVDWPTPLNEMISNRDGRSILRLYAYSAGVRLMSALRYFSMDFDVFRNGLQRLWLLRAQRYFDGSGNEIPYIRHRFTTDRDRMYSSIELEDIHTIDDANLLVSRNLHNFTSRNLVFDRWSGNHILSILDLGFYRRSNIGFNESFSASAADYYLQDHIDQSYQIIFFILELQLRGINTDEDDHYNETIPNDIMPLAIQIIAWNYEAYQNYLKFWAEHIQILLKENLKRCAAKEDLIIQLSLLIMKKNERKNTMTTTASSTLAMVTTTSTESPWNDKGSKKGGARMGDCGKYFLPSKRYKKMDNQNFQTNSNNNYYGYTMYNDNSNQLIGWSSFFSNNIFENI